MSAGVVCKRHFPHLMRHLICWAMLENGWATFMCHVPFRFSYMLVTQEEWVDKWGVDSYQDLFPPPSPLWSINGCQQNVKESCWIAGGLPCDGLASYPGARGEVISKISGRMDILTSFFPWCLNGDSLLLQRPCHLYQSPPPFASGALPYLVLLTCQVL